MGIIKDLQQASKADFAAPNDSSYKERMQAASYNTTDYATSRVILTVGYDGEKNLGEAGPIKDYVIDYPALRLRSWQEMIESEVAQMLIGTYVTWVVGGGLKLQAEPKVGFIKKSGYVLDANQFSEDVEEMYELYSSAREADYSNQLSKDLLSEQVLKNAIVGGDCLVIQRYENGSITIQVIDGAHVVSPSSSYPGNVLPNGNRIEHGIELSPRNEHVAYYVRKKALENKPNDFDNSFETERIEARGKESGMLMAFMVYGLRYRLDNVRGLPLIACVIETIKKMERYKEATVGSAEERQKIPYYIKHGLGSTGENPMNSRLVKAFNYDANTDLPVDIVGNQLANTIAVSTNKSVFNMPQDSALQALDSRNELNFPNFYETNFNFVAATLGIPPDIAKKIFNSNYSASRAAIKDWEHNLLVKRKYHAFQFEQPVYNLVLHVWILQRLVKAPGYLEAFAQGRWMLLAAYRKARFVGASVPHIDPLKEVEAERLKLGSLGATIPLTTVEAATESLNSGDSDANMKQFAAELEASKALGLEAPAPEIVAPAVPKKQ